VPKIKGLILGLSTKTLISNDRRVKPRSSLISTAGDRTTLRVGVTPAGNLLTSDEAIPDAAAIEADIGDVRVASAQRNAPDKRRLSNCASTVQAMEAGLVAGIV